MLASGVNLSKVKQKIFTHQDTILKISAGKINLEAI